MIPATCPFGIVNFKLTSFRPSGSGGGSGGGGSTGGGSTGGGSTMTVVCWAMHISSWIMTSFPERAIDIGGSLKYRQIGFPSSNSPRPKMPCSTPSRMPASHALRLMSRASPGGPRAGLVELFCGNGVGSEISLLNCYRLNAFKDFAI